MRQDHRTPRGAQMPEWRARQWADDSAVAGPRSPAPRAAGGASGTRACRAHKLRCSGGCVASYVWPPRVSTLFCLFSLPAVVGPCGGAKSLTGRWVTAEVRCASPRVDGPCQSPPLQAVALTHIAMPNPPTSILYHGRNTGKDKDSKKLWTRIGAVWHNNSGKGFHLTWDDLPPLNF